MAPIVKTVLFACIHNAGRSQIAAAYFNALADSASASLLVTMGCGEECPLVPGVHRQDWQVGDPKGLQPDAVRRIRDEIRARVEALVDAEDCRASARPSSAGGVTAGPSE